MPTLDQKPVGTSLPRVDLAYLYNLRTAGIFSGGFSTKRNAKLVFQYNPTSLRVSETTNWAVAEVPGIDVPLYQWVSGGETSIPLRLFFNEYKEGVRLDRPVVYEGYVEEQIAWLRDAKTPKAVTFGGRVVRQAPDPLRLIWGRIDFGERAPGITVVITAMEVERTFFKRGSGLGIRATIDLELRRIPEYGVY